MGIADKTLPWFQIVGVLISFASVAISVIGVLASIVVAYYVYTATQFTRQQVLANTRPLALVRDVIISTGKESNSIRVDILVQMHEGLGKPTVFYWVATMRNVHGKGRSDKWRKYSNTKLSGSLLLKDQVKIDIPLEPLYLHENVLEHTKRPPFKTIPLADYLLKYEYSLTGGRRYQTRATITIGSSGGEIRVLKISYHTDAAD